MSFFTPKNTQPGLQEAIDTALLKLKETTPGSEDYAEIVTQLDKLYKAKSYTKDEPLVKLDTVITVGANLLGIVAILSFEQARVVTSKALAMVLKAKV